MMTIDKELVKKAMEESGFTPSIIDSVTHKGFYDAVMSQDDPDSNDIYKLYGVLNIKEPKKKRSYSVPRKIGCMVSINKDTIIDLIQKHGWNRTTFAEYCGIKSSCNLSIMLNRGTMKLNSVKSICRALNIPLADVITDNSTNIQDIHEVPKFYPKELEKNIEEFTLEVDASKMHNILSRFGCNKIAKIMHVPVMKLKACACEGSVYKRIPISSVQYLCDSNKGIELDDIITAPEQPIKPEDIPQATITDTSNHDDERIPNPFYKGEARGNYFSFSEYCTRVSEEKSHEKYMEEQHKQESIITANQRSLDMHKKELMHDGMVSIEALVKITNMLQQNPEVQDLFVALATLPDSKRQHAINALNTLITSLS